MEVKTPNILNNFYQEIKFIFLGVSTILIYIILTELIIWNTHNYIFFNNYFLGTNFEFLFYVLPDMLSAGLSVIIVCNFNRIPQFLRILILLIINSYLMSGIHRVLMKTCEEIKNESDFDKVLMIIFMSIASYLVIRKILPKISRKEIIIISITTFLLILDLQILLFGYSIFLSYF